MKKIHNKKLAYQLITICIATIIIVLCMFISKLPELYSTEIIEPDENGMYKIGKHYFESLYPLNEESIENAANKINMIYEKYLTDSNKVFYAIVPDKSYYVRNRVYKTLDYDKMIEILNDKINSNITYIPIKDTLELNDYLKTDYHWRQEKIIDTANRIGEYLGYKIFETDFRKNTYDSFRGYYTKFVDNDNVKEKISYLVNKYTENAIIENSRNIQFNTVYDEIKLNSEIQYDLFLSGVAPLINIINPLAQNDKELIIFRDSFASCFTPLIISEYKKITLVDIRYISSLYLDRDVDFNDKDILFLYNSGVINDSSVLR